MPDRHRFGRVSIPPQPQRISYVKRRATSLRATCGLEAIKVVAVALTTLLVTACSTPPKREAVQQPNQPDSPETPVGLILHRYALQRSQEECKEKGKSEADCSTSIAEAQAHLQSVNQRLDALLKDPKTNMCDLVRWTGACHNPILTVGDLADCLQTSADRGEALNSGRFILRLDEHGCPTDRK
jgi:hypothetical protein